MIKNPHYLNSRAIDFYSQGKYSEALKDVERGKELDHKFAWPSLNSIALTRLAYNGAKIVNYDQREDASSVKQDLFYDLVATKNNIESYVLPRQEAVCKHLL